MWYLPNLSKRHRHLHYCCIIDVVPIVAAIPSRTYNMPCIWGVISGMEYMPNGSVKKTREEKKEINVKMKRGFRNIRATTTCYTLLGKVRQKVVIEIFSITEKGGVIESFSSEKRKVPPNKLMEKFYCPVRKPSPRFQMAIILFGNIFFILLLFFSYICDPIWEKQTSFIVYFYIRPHLCGKHV